VSFVFCINFLMLPIERSMKHHRTFPKVMVTSFTMYAHQPQNKTWVGAPVVIPPAHACTYAPWGCIV